MEILVSNIKSGLDEDICEVINKVCKKYKIKYQDVKNYRIVKESVDARKKDNIRLIFSLAIDIPHNTKFKVDNDIKLLEEVSNEKIDYGEIGLTKRPVIIGAGPAGLFAAYTLANEGFRPIIFERGEDVESRKKTIQSFWNKGELNVESNIQFGEGGAGTFSDGKLTTRINDSRCKNVLEVLCSCGAPKEILYNSKPHIGSDKLITVVKNLRNKIIEKGGEIHFNKKLTDISINNDKIESITINNNQKIDTDILILAIGHSSRETFEMLVNKNVNIIQKSFSVGVRIEHNQDLINKIQHGKFAGHPRLKNAEYQLFHKTGERTCYSFCMCPGGTVVGSASEKNTIVTNGMSEYKRDLENANSALVVSVDCKDFISHHPLAGMEYQRNLERKAFEIAGSDYSAPIQRLEDFLLSKPSTKIGKIKPSYTGKYSLVDLNNCLPDYISNSLKSGIEAFDKKMKGYNTGDAILTGVETRTSSPVRIVRGVDFESTNVKSFYPIGEGAGYAGGIMSSAVDGIRVAQKIISKYFSKL